MKYSLLFALLSFTYAVFSQTRIDESAIQEAMIQVAAKHHLSENDIETYRISDQYVQKKNGSTHVYLLQTVNGLDVFNAQMQLHFSKKGKLVFSNSSFVKDKQSKINTTSASIDFKNAFLPVLDTFLITSINEKQMNFELDSSDNQTLVSDDLFFHPVRAKLGYEKVGNTLILVYQYTLEPRADKKMYVVKVDASSGKVIRIINRTLECKLEHEGHSDKSMLIVPFPQFSEDEPATPKTGAMYNAFPLGIESPIHGNRTIITNVENPAASPFGWHDTDGITGSEYTTTNGNNVFVYEDTTGLDELGYSPEGGPAMTFDFPLNLNLYPTQNMDAALTNLFVWNNFLHDVSYHYGFDEESGNFQMNNYGNGGSEVDPVAAEGIDGGGSNNANFATPEDGFSPRMQMYVWVHGEGEMLTVNTPSSIAGSYLTGISTFGLEAVFPSVTADIALVNSGGSNPTHGCDFPLNDVAGKIVLMDRGTCTFPVKALWAQEAGAVGVIIVNNVSGGAMSMSGDDEGLLVIPVISISLADGNLIKSELQNGTINATLGGTAEMSYIDGDFDNGVISHEYGHGISNRLTGGPSQVDCLWNDEQAGEGWSDFFSLIMTNTAANTAEQARGIGNFASNNVVTGNGIRTYPYSRNMLVNPMTYSEVANAAVPHGVGSIWCTMLWDLYWDMVDEYGNSNDLYATNGGNNKAIQLVVEGMRMQVCEPGFVDSRDAILAADELLFDGENACLIWKTFARRGLGFSADQGSSSSTGDETEAFDMPDFCNIGINEMDALDFNVYPVPASDVLKISNSKGLEINELVIVDLSGKEVLRKQTTGAESQLDISALNNGAYLLQIHADGISFQKRFVIL